MNISLTQLQPFSSIWERLHIRKTTAFGVIILGALIAFETFNYSTTEFALSDLLGNLTFAGLRWATILAIAFCSIDFAGIARLFTPDDSTPNTHSTWYLLGAWLLAASMNAMLTWWGVSIAVLEHQSLGNAVIGQQTMLRIVPIFVAILVWLIRVLIIGSFSVAGERLFSQNDRAETAARKPALLRPISNPAHAVNRPSAGVPMATPVRQGGMEMKNKSAVLEQDELNDAHLEPTYHPVSLGAAGRNSSNGQYNHIRQ
ncbi:MAG: hypothetical protein ACPL3P_04295 [Anaerolineales bacterium]